jgi:hypothetical protein
MIHLPEFASLLNVRTQQSPGERHGQNAGGKMKQAFYSLILMKLSLAPDKRSITGV